MDQTFVVDLTTGEGDPPITEDQLRTAVAGIPFDGGYIAVAVRELGDDEIILQQYFDLDL